jgi:Pyridoxamine 5'-phosphate oxidase
LNRSRVKAGKRVFSVAVARWAEFKEAEPEFASRVRGLMGSRKHLTMATLRRDGSPRISGTEVEFDDDELRIGSMLSAVKALDLRRDPRVAIHGPTEDPPQGNPSGWKGEAKIAGTAKEIDSGVDAHHFHIDINEVVITRLNAAGDRLVVESWNPSRGYRIMERE